MQFTLPKWKSYLDDSFIKPFFLYGSLFYNINTGAVEDFTKRGQSGFYFLNMYFKSYLFFHLKTCFVLCRNLRP